MGKDVIWTDITLDGACSYLIFKWIKKADIDVFSTTYGNFKTNFENWKASNKISDYDKIYILNMDLSKFIDLVDLPNVVIIDRHKSHIEYSKKYKNAKVILEESTSNSKLLLKLFNKNIKFTQSQLTLISLVDDYESGKNKSRLSRELNIVYWGLSGKKPQKFCEEFLEGFVKFNLQHQNIISLYDRKLQETLETMDVYLGSLKVSPQVNYKIASTFSNHSHDDICNFLIDNYNVDVAIIVNTDTQSVFFKRSDICKLPMYKLAETLCGGGGNDVVAGGKITEKFMDFTKILNKI